MRRPENSFIITTLFWCAFALLGWNSSAQADTLTVSEDTYVDSAYATTKFGSSDTLASGTWASSNPIRINRTYLKFDLSGLATGKIITSATLYGYYDADTPFTGGNPDLEHTLYVIGDSWAEDELTWNTQPDLAAKTYLANWTPPAAADVWQSWTVTDAVSAQYSGDGFLSIMIAASDETTLKSREVFSSRDLGSGANAFYLDITLSDSPVAVVPAPTTMLLFAAGLASLAGFGRRSRLS